jgi:isoleucyl-tRNA synthetase
VLNPKELEEKILDFWEEDRIFQKSLIKTRNGKPFTFYDGPPFATGLPHYGHILASTIKDLIPRYQTMKGRFVRRRWGWDCHGLPIEELVERHLGISGKKQIEEIGIEKFNRICREKVLEFAEEWGKMVRRIARWIDFDNSYKTMDRDYMESVWWAFKQIYDKGLIYEGRKVLMYCPRCETPVSNFEVAMDNSYQDVTEEAVFVKFKVKAAQNLNLTRNTYFLAWTTTPWTLPGNVALAVGEEINYVLASRGGEDLILAKERLAVLGGEYEIKKEFTGRELEGWEYEPLFEVPAVQSDKTFRVYPADFVSTAEGTGIVHTAVVYGEEDYELGQKVGLPVVPLLDDRGLFNDKAPPFLRGKYFKDADGLIIEDLEKRGLLLYKEKITHSYPHCWRCGTPLYYNAIPAWFINIQKIKRELINSNAKEINWFPAHLKFGRYEKSVESAPDWNISRNRYWGNPIPVWKCPNANLPEGKGCSPIVVGSIKELNLSRNTFYFVRHGESEKNVLGIINGQIESDKYDLTPAGIRQAEELGEKMKTRGGVDLIFTSDFLRTKRTAEIVGKILSAEVHSDERLREYNTGVFEGRKEEDYKREFAAVRNRWTEAPPGGETWMQVQERMISFLKETERRYEGKKILIVSHGDPLWLVQKYYGSERPYPDYGEPFEISLGIDDLHRPYIDAVVLKCPNCGGEARRVKEIFDSWFEAGSMPFAEYHYPFDQKEVFESRFPAQFVAEYIAQTRAWFYVMHVIAYLLFGRAPFENVVTTGTILAEDGSKMSKSKNNFPDPWLVLNKYGVDALRFYLMNSAVMQADNVNFSEKEVQNIYRKVVLILGNVLHYYQTYAPASVPDLRTLGAAERERLKILDRWILVRTQELVGGVTESLDNYDTVRATRLMADYIDDLSTWYLRRSRGRKDAEFFAVLRHSLLTASKVMAPVMPYISELIFREVRRGAGSAETSEAESVHLADWPAAEEITEKDKELLRSMAVIREAASLGWAIRKTLNIPARQPLPRLAFFTKEEMTPTKELLQILLEELNVKKFDSALSAEKGENVKMIAGTLRILNFYLDIAVSEELRWEGLIRGLERAIQELRKKRGLKVGEMASLVYETEDPDIKKALQAFNREKTYIGSVSEGLPALGDGEEEIFLDGKKVKLAVFLQ